MCIYRQTPSMPLGRWSFVVMFLLGDAAFQSPFNLRENCIGEYLDSRYSVTCNATKHNIQEKNLHLDERNTRGVYEINLSSFESIIIQSSVQVAIIRISNTNQVSIFVNNLILKDLIIDSVDKLTVSNLRLEEKGHLKRMNSLTLANIKTLELISEGEFILPVKTMSLKNIDDLELKTSQLTISATNLTIIESKIRLNGKSSFVLDVIAARVDSSYFDIFNSGFLNISATNFNIEDSKIDLESGSTINIINSKKVTFSNNSFYEMENQSILILGKTLLGSVIFVNNEIFRSDIADVLSYKNKKVTLKDNVFDCTDCSVKNKLLAIDLQDVGDVNYCYTSCNLSINRFKQLINNHCLCSGSSTRVNFTTLCETCVSTNSEPEISDFNLFRMVLFLVIPIIIVGFLLLFVFCCKNNLNRFKSLVSTSSSNQDLDCCQKGQQVIVFRRECYDNDECLYEEVGLSPVTAPQFGHTT